MITPTDTYSTPEHRLDDPERFARGLGWLSIGVGLAQIAAPRGVARMIGVDDDETSRNTLFAIGVREIASGVGILTRERPTGPLWGRVGGDVMDLALLGRALGNDRAQKNRVAAATAAVVGVTILDILAGQALSREPGARSASSRLRGIEIRRSITVNRPPEDVYRFWRNFENLPQFMEHLESVRVIDDRRSHWIARAPAGATVEWDAEITEDRPGELIGWRAVQHAQVPNRGAVRFAPSPDGGTEVRVELRYEPPGGKLGAGIAKLFGEEPGQQVSGDLRRFKQVMELGEVVHSDASIHRGMHPARPADAPAGLSMQPQGVLS